MHSPSQRLAAEASAAKLADAAFGASTPAQSDSQVVQAKAADAHAVERAQQLAQQERTLEGQIREIAPAPSASPDLAARAAATDRELHRRTALAVQKVIADPPAYIVDAIGRRPDRPAHRSAWHEAIRQIEGYRLRFGVRDGSRTRQ